jgi:HD-GYP domain-containing protein (c-di-GMP phosphodiesterase class II)
MLEALPWPKHLKNVPEYAGGHHERMDGKGYPRGLTKDQMSPQARMMAIADIFEALTAADRPYKKGKTLTESLNILGKMATGGHVDLDLFDIFIRKKVYLQYAQLYMNPEQIDAVDESAIPGYVP